MVYLENKLWLRKTNRTFNGSRGLINHILKQYENYDNPMLQAYIENNELQTIPKCLCGKDRIFISFSKGFRHTCDDLSCVNKAASVRSKSRYIDGYQEYVLNNLDFYKTNWKSKNVIDHYNGYSSKGITFSRYVFRFVKDKDPTSHPWINISRCVYCDSEIKTSIFSSKPIPNVCDSDRCKLFKSHKSHLSDDIFLKYKPYITMNSTDESYINRVCQMITERESLSKTEISKVMRRLFDKEYSIPKNSSYCHELRMFLSPITMVGYLNKNNVDLNDFLRRNYYNECFKSCLNCGKEIQTSFFPRPEQKHELDYCSHSCYSEYISTDAGQKKYGFNTIESKTKQSETMKRKIEDGSFTPTVTNSWCRSKSEVSINGKVVKYRSSWEVVFGILNSHLNYETVRIPYMRSEGTTHNYIVDFEDPVNKILYEIKPDSLLDDVRVVAKRDAAIKWCDEKGYTYVVIGNDWYKDCLCRLSNHSLIRKCDPTLTYVNKVMKGIKWKLFQ